MIRVLSWQGVDVEELDDKSRVRFPVHPPTLHTPDGQAVELNSNEGFVDVEIRDGELRVRGCFPIVIVPESSNSFIVRLRDAVR